MECHSARVKEETQRKRNVREPNAVIGKSQKGVPGWVTINPRGR